MFILELLVCIVAVARIFGIKTIAFQAVAHLTVGWLFGAYHGSKRKYWLYLGILLTVVEILCFLASLVQKGI